MGKAALDVVVGGDVHFKGDVRIQLFCERDHALSHTFDVRERQLRALATHGLGNPPGNGTIRGKSDDQCALAVQKTHYFSLGLGASRQSLGASRRIYGAEAAPSVEFARCASSIPAVFWPIPVVDSNRRT